jgi:hypothetical protein
MKSKVAKAVFIGYVVVVFLVGAAVGLVLANLVTAPS